MENSARRIFFREYSHGNQAPETIGISIQKYFLNNADSV